MDTKTGARTPAAEALGAIDPAAFAAARAGRPGWTPFPRAHERGAWDRIDPATAAEVLGAAREAAASPWPVLTAGGWLAFARGGDRRAYEDGYFTRRRRLTALALALALEPGGPWLDPLVDGAWSVLEESSWCVPAHDNSTHHPAAQREARALPDPTDPTLDLFAAETAATLSWLAALHRERAQDDPALADLFQRVSREVDERVLVPFEEHAREHHWFGIPSNWNPWIVSNVLATALVEDLGPRRWERITRTAHASLLAYRDGVPEDGGCAEGVMYWWQSAGRYFEALELLTAFDASAREVTAADPLLARLARYPLVVHLGGPWSANVGDGGARAPRADSGTVKDQNPAGLLHRFARYVGDDDVARHARSLRGDGPLLVLPVPLTRALGVLADGTWAGAREAGGAFPRTQYLDRLQLLATRERGGTAEGLALVVKGGHNGEPHNHNDVGSFIVASDGVPVVVDAGTGTYTRDSFGPRRYEAWFTRSVFHSTPTPDGREQPCGAGSAASDVELLEAAGRTALSMELAGAYPPGDLRSWRRTAALDRTAHAVVVQDTWSSSRPLRPSLHLLLAGVEGVEGVDGARVLARAPEGEDATPLTITFHDAGADAEVVVDLETVELDDPQLRAVWGGSLVRLTARPAGPRATGAVVTTIRRG
ncbi:heparinase II/III domain-containing protein [Kineococcus sp. SYSU DK001]|uniref:heparinase II/III domain-containing protein n=1 Tax=Kineococcus sp. SYSU DK001 TaxID=3383122 RepID=UPI003D7EAE88